jgi:hypothetical protein
VSDKHHSQFSSCPPREFPAKGVGGELFLHKELFLWDLRRAKKFPAMYLRTSIEERIEATAKAAEKAALAARFVRLVADAFWLQTALK